MDDFFTLIGLNSTEIKVYRLLLTNGPLTPLEITKSSGISRSTVYQKIESLIAKKFVTWIKRGKQKCAEAVSPSVLEKIVKNNEKHTALLKKAYDVWIQEINRLFYSRPQDTRRIMTFSGVDDLKEIILNNNIKDNDVVFYTKETLECAKTVFRESSLREIAFSVSCIISSSFVIYFNKAGKHMHGHIIHDKVNASFIRSSLNA